jgi:SAM-dependent methyltransferase
MQLPLSGPERFLAGFHDADPGGTARAFGGIPATMAGAAFASSYECLAGAVPSAATGVLDLACGDGYLLSLLAARRPTLQLVGVDLSAGELEAARRRLGPSVPLHQARAQQLPLADAAVDAVLCHMALMLMDDAPQVLAEVRRVLQPGGVFSAVVGGGSASPAHQVFVGLLREQRRLPQFESLRLGDRRLHSAEGIDELFAASGFEPPAVEEIVLQWRSPPAGLWSWFDKMYDPGWLAAQDRIALERSVLQALQPLCEADGRIPHRVMLRRITARRGPG